ncbi:MAG: hypothetical protein J6D28_02970 [Bacilli bacterium]|nr:hypothetical protein [Bacilli bacterium]
MVYAIKNKHKIIHILLIYLLNMYYIPCYYLKHVIKDTKYKLKNIIYIILSIILTITLIAWYLILEIEGTSYTTYISDDNVVSLKIPIDYYQDEVGEYDMYFFNDTVNIGIFLYDNENYSSHEILDDQANYLIKTRKNMKLINSNNNQNITTYTYSGNYEGNENIYNLSVITFDKKPNYYVYVIEITLKENYKKNRKEMQKILEQISLNNF